MEYQGLTSSEAGEKLKTVGPNQIKSHKDPLWKKILKWIVSPISLMLIAAAILSFSVHKIADVVFILVLLVLNIFISLWHERKADEAIEKLQEHLTVKVMTLRDGEWTQISSVEIVPGDIIQLRTGNIVPADAKILEAKNLTANESALSGESLPKEKKVGEMCFSGSFITTGFTIAQVTATGEKTYFGATLLSVEKVKKRSLLEEDILSIAKYLAALSIFAALVLSAVLLFEHKSIIDVATLDLSMLIAGIPVSLPTVMTLIISVGVLLLAQKSVIVRKISSLENLSNVNLLLTDKTGTITQNEIQLVSIIPHGGFSKEAIARFAYLATLHDDSTIRDAVMAFYNKENIGDGGYEVVDFTPYDPDRKRSTTEVRLASVSTVVTFGAPQMVVDLVEANDEEKQQFLNEIDQAAKEGYRTLAIATHEGTEEKNMTWAGLVLFSDTLRPEAANTLDFMRDHGIDIKIVSGDNKAITQRVTHEVGIEGAVLGAKEIAAIHFDQYTEADFQKVAAFAEVTPADKYHLVEFAKKHAVVAMTGDGVNDIPPVEAADVGMAVQNAVDSLKGAADIVILSNGIDVIKDAILESRKIFSRLYTYAVYRISESLRVIFNILLIGVLYQEFPLIPLQLLILAFLNDVPIISLAFDRVEISKLPPPVERKKKFFRGSLFGLTGIISSFLFFILLKNYVHLGWGTLQTMFFLKLAVSGHMLIYVAHTKRRWYKFLPSPIVIAATIGTQVVATSFALLGLFMPAISWGQIGFVWLWSLLWMQVTELVKIISLKLEERMA